MTPITRGTIERLRWDNIDMKTVGLVCEEQKTIQMEPNLRRELLLLNWKGMVDLC
jgi:hypothetical protein